MPESDPGRRPQAAGAHRLQPDDRRPQLFPEPVRPADRAAARGPHAQDSVPHAGGDLQVPLPLVLRGAAADGHHRAGARPPGAAVPPALRLQELDGGRAEGAQLVLQPPRGAPRDRGAAGALALRPERGGHLALQGAGPAHQQHAQPRDDRGPGAPHDHRHRRQLPGPGEGHHHHFRSEEQFGGQDRLRQESKEAECVHHQE